MLVDCIEIVATEPLTIKASLYIVIFSPVLFYFVHERREDCTPRPGVEKVSLSPIPANLHSTTSYQGSRQPTRTFNLNMFTTIHPQRPCLYRQKQQSHPLEANCSNSPTTPPPPIAKWPSTSTCPPKRPRTPSTRLPS